MVPANDIHTSRLPEPSLVSRKLLHLSQRSYYANIINVNINAIKNLLSKCVDLINQYGIGKFIFRSVGIVISHTEYKYVDFFKMLNGFHFRD